MELLYIWIEDYKNIYRQGFNFSPKHHFEFIPEGGGGTIIKGELVHENIEYDLPYNFFGNNIINITGIVGKNGSGKSSLLEFIFSSNILKGEKCIFVFIDNHNAKPQIITKYKIDNFEKKGIKYNRNNSCLELMYFSNVFDAKPHTEIFSDKDSGETCIRTNDISTRKAMYFLLPDKFIELIEDDKKETHGIELYKSREIRKQLLFFQSKISKTVGIDLDLFIPEEITISFFSWIKDYLFQKDSTLQDVKSILIKENKGKKKSLSELFIKISILYFITAYEDNYKINEKQIKKCYEKPQEYFEDLYIERRLSEQNIEKIDRMNFDEKMKKEYKSKSSNEKYISELFVELKKTITEGGTNISYEKECFKFKIEEKGINKILNILIELIKFLQIDVFQFSWNNLSSGENALFSLFARFSDIDPKEIYSENILILLDEPDLYLHPEWQKQLFYNLKVGLEKIFCYDAENKPNNRKLQIITSSHSPFIVSDLPKEHIIFLDKDNKDKGRCKVIPDIDQKETFGANIHTLFTNSFFMQNSLIGKFAEEKIKKAINYLNKSELSQNEIEYCEQIINIIGEPILKNQLQKMLKYKIEDTNKSEIDVLKKQMRYLKSKISKLENNK